MRLLFFLLTVLLLGNAGLSFATAAEDRDALNYLADWENTCIDLVQNGTKEKNKNVSLQCANSLEAFEDYFAVGGACSVSTWCSKGRQETAALRTAYTNLFGSLAFSKPAKSPSGVGSGTTAAVGGVMCKNSSYSFGADMRIAAGCNVATGSDDVRQGCGMLPRDPNADASFDSEVKYQKSIGKLFGKSLGHFMMGGQAGPRRAFIYGARPDGDDDVAPARPHFAVYVAMTPPGACNQPARSAVLPAGTVRVTYPLRPQFICTSSGAAGDNFMTARKTEDGDSVASPSGDKFMANFGTRDNVQSAGISQRRLTCYVLLPSVFRAVGYEADMRNGAQDTCQIAQALMEDPSFLPTEDTFPHLIFRGTNNGTTPPYKGSNPHRNTPLTKHLSGAINPSLLQLLEKQRLVPAKSRNNSSERFYSSCYYSSDLALMNAFPLDQLDELMVRFYKRRLRTDGACNAKKAKFAAGNCGSLKDSSGKCPEISCAGDIIETTLDPSASYSHGINLMVLGQTDLNIDQYLNSEDDTLRKASLELGKVVTSISSAISNTETKTASDLDVHCEFDLGAIHGNRPSWLPVDPDGKTVAQPLNWDTFNLHSKNTTFNCEDMVFLENEDTGDAVVDNENKAKNAKLRKYLQRKACSSKAESYLDKIFNEKMKEYQDAYAAATAAGRPFVQEKPVRPVEDDDYVCMGGKGVYDLGSISLQSHHAASLGRGGGTEVQSVINAFLQMRRENLEKDGLQWMSDSECGDNPGAGFSVSNPVDVGDVSQLYVARGYPFPSPPVPIANAKILEVPSLFGATADDYENLAHQDANTWVFYAATGCEIQVTTSSNGGGCCSCWFPVPKPWQVRNVFSGDDFKGYLKNNCSAPRENAVNSVGTVSR